MILKSFGVFGNPIKHSKSPLIHNACFLAYKDKLGFLGHYHPLLLPLEKSLKKVFLNLGLCGANVTLPFKEEAFKICHRVEGIAKQCGSVNTLILENDEIIGYNTDALGFYRTLKYPFKNALILGAGGSARALACELLKQGIEVSVLNRSKEKLEFFKQIGCECKTWQDLPQKSFELVVNTTSASLDNKLPLASEPLITLLKKSQLAYDLMYNTLTPFLSLAHSMGIEIQDGTNMLLAQASLSFEYFSHHTISYEEAFKIMQSVL
ncbi:shikimate dehydrogenase [Helicobacter cetorum]|uniref:shikimate dehydrogenase n=1 Tax=Helicobacter cetorum TaxID=138563 RepID=UPI000CF0C9C0|nr:shikimate dehydrogenase [Helicobacter cetorum]